MKKFSAFVLLALSFFTVYAGTGFCIEDGHCFDCYDSLQNLPQNHVVAFSKSPDGYMFVAGRNFLARFDGGEFVFPDGGRLADMPTSRINDFVIGENGTGYVATDLGLWTTDTGDFENRSFKHVGNIGNFNVKSLSYNEKKNAVFGAVEGKGVFSVSAGGGVEWFNPASSRLGTKNVNKIFVDSLGTVWLGTENGIYFMKDGSGRFVQIDYLDDSISAFAEGTDNIIYAGGKNCFYTIENGEVSIGCENKEKVPPYADITVLETDDSDRLWIGTKNGGLFPDENHYLDLGGAITASARDKEGNVWFGTSAGGFCIAKRSAFKGMEFSRESVSGVLSDSAGNILVNTKNGIVRQREDGNWETSCDERGCQPVFGRIFIDKLDNIWASDESGLYILQQDGIYKPVKELYQSKDDLFPVSSDIFFSDSDGNVWVNDLSIPGALFVFRNDRSAERFILPDADAETVDIIMHDGHIFAVTKRGGVFKFEENGTFKPLPIWEKEIFVKRAFVDSKQRIWIVTLSDEIFVDIEKDAIAFPLASIRGKASVRSVREDRNGNFWIMTNIGVAFIKGADADCFISGSCTDVPVILYGKKDGMASWECAEGRTSDAVISKEGILFVPMTDGVALFDTNFEENRDFVPEIRIDAVSYEDNGKTQYFNAAAGTSLPHTVRNLKISYSAPLFKDAGNLLFDYSFDNEHVRGTTERTVVFSDVQSGMHEFSVRAYTSGNPSKFREKRLSFHVTPVFYEKKSFIILVPFVVILFFATIIFLNRRLKAIRDAETKRLIDEKTAELRMKNNTLKEAVMKDPLTGLMNRRYMFEVEERKIRRFIESRERKMHLLDNRNVIEKNDVVYGIIMMDIDHFKRVNDIYGHDAGDIVLKGIADIMQDSVRADDILIRWGGEEFLIVLKNIPAKTMIDVAKKIRKAIEMHPFETQNGASVWVTASMGVVFLPFFNSDPKLLTFENVVTIADLALYNSKENGRDMATLVVPGTNLPKTADDINGMLSSGEFAAVNGFYSFEKIEPDNFSEFEI